jgi:hypothetical protein
MALGFKNCCDSNEYFYLTGIPGYVSEFEIYYIETIEGEIFCGEYVEIPALNYQPTTYNLVGMTAQTSCTSCILLNPCPTGITVDLNAQYSTTALVNDCSLKTIFPMEVSCVKTLPSETDSLDGQVGLYIIGGTPPYSIYTGTSTTAVGQSTNGQTFQVYSNVSAGTYTSIVYDFYGDYVQTISCVLSGVPISIIANCSSISPTYYGGNNGSFYITIDGGTQPFTYTFSGVTTTGNDSFSAAGLTAGTYTILVTDGGDGIFQQTETVTCTVSNPAPIDYPTDLCLTFQLCGTLFFLNFTSGSTQNYHPVYSLVNTSDIGVTSMTLSYGTNGWVSSVENQNPFSVPIDCSIGIISFTKNPSPLNDQPTGIWIGGGIGDIVGTTITALEGSCSTNTQAIVVDLQYQTEPGCSFNDNTGSVTLIAASNAGGPFTYYVDGAQQNSTVVFGLSVGSHTAQAIDSNGNSSPVISFEILDIEPISVNFEPHVTNPLPDTYPVSTTLTYLSNVTYPLLPQGAQITTGISFLPQININKVNPTSNIYTNISLNIVQTLQNGTQLTIPMSVTTTTNSGGIPFPNGITCPFYELSNYTYLSDSELTINSGDQLDIEITLDWSFDSTTPFAAFCSEQIELNGIMLHTNPQITDGCQYLWDGFTTNYMFKVSSLVIQRTPTNPVSGEIVGNGYGPE